MSAGDPQISGVEELLFGVDDMDSARRFLDLYGLTEVEHAAGLSRWEALDGSAVVLRPTHDGSLPPPVIDGPTGRRYIWGVRDTEALDRIAGELSRDREVRVDNEGLVDGLWDGRAKREHRGRPAWLRRARIGPVRRTEAWFRFPRPW